MNSEISSPVLFVGLGNPGKSYSKNRHNVGFLFLDFLAKQIPNNTQPQTQWVNDKKIEAEKLTLEKNNRKIILAKPTTSMNLSGRTVRKGLDYYNISQSSTYIIFDDLDINIGKFKVQLGKFPKSHNGIKSIKNHVEKIENITSIRIGIESRENKNIPGRNFVLSDFSTEELNILKQHVFPTIWKDMFSTICEQ